MLERQKAYVERLPNGIEIGTRHEPKCIQPWGLEPVPPEASERSLIDVEYACDAATVAVEKRYPWYLRALWYIERSVWCRKWLRRLRLFRRRPYQFKDAVTHRSEAETCRWLCLVTIHKSEDVACAAIAAERYLYDRGYQIVEKF